MLGAWKIWKVNDGKSAIKIPVIRKINLSKIKETVYPQVRASLKRSTDWES